jgi:plasmid stabilization system protein ParE
MRIRKTGAAHCDLQRAFRHCAAVNPHAARRLILAIDAKFAFLAAWPKSGRERPDFDDAARGHIILYRPTETEIIVRRVFDGRIDSEAQRDT